MSDDYAPETVWAREVEALRSYLEDCHEPLYAGRSATQELRAIAARFEGAETDQERDQAVRTLPRSRSAPRPPGSKAPRPTRSGTGRSRTLPRSRSAPRSCSGTAPPADA